MSNNKRQSDKEYNAVTALGIYILIFSILVGFGSAVAIMLATGQL